MTYDEICDKYGIMRFNDMIEDSTMKFAIKSFVFKTMSNFYVKNSQCDFNLRNRQLLKLPKISNEKQRNSAFYRCPMKINELFRKITVYCDKIKDKTSEEVKKIDEDLRNEKNFSMVFYCKKILARAGKNLTQFDSII